MESGRPRRARRIRTSVAERMAGVGMDEGNVETWMGVAEMRNFFGKSKSRIGRESCGHGPRTYVCTPLTDGDLRTHGCKLLNGMSCGRATTHEISASPV